MLTSAIATQRVLLAFGVFLPCNSCCLTTELFVNSMSKSSVAASTHMHAVQGCALSSMFESLLSTGASVIILITAVLDSSECDSGDIAALVDVPIFDADHISQW